MSEEATSHYGRNPTDGEGGSGGSASSSWAVRDQRMDDQVRATTQQRKYKRFRGPITDHDRTAYSGPRSLEIKFNADREQHDN